MKLQMLKNLLIFSSLLTLMSCQPGTALVTVLGQVSGFDLTETTQILKSKTNKNPFYISGRCSASIKEVEVSFDNGANYTPLSQFAESFSKDCSASGTFSYRINPNNTIAFDIPADLSYKDFKIRGTGDFGASAVQNFRRMVNSGGDLQLTAGSVKVEATTVSGTPVILRARVISSAGVSSGSNFKFKGAIRIK